MKAGKYDLCLSARTYNQWSRRGNGKINFSVIGKYDSCGILIKLGGYLTLRLPRVHMTSRLQHVKVSELQLSSFSFRSHFT